jgi:LPS sulfotransferase NodH
MSIIEEFDNMQTVRKAIKDPRKAFKYISNKALASFGHLNYTHFIVLSRSRTGSNMLISFLNSHPNLFAEGEIFNSLNGRNYQDILAKAFGKQPLNIKAKGFKIFYYHPVDDQNSEIWNELIKLENLHVIHLKRKNIFRALVSNKIAKQQKVWLKRSSGIFGKVSAIFNKSSSQENPKTVSFSAEEVEKGFMQTREWEKVGDEKFKNHPLYNMYYEDLTTDPNKGFRRVTEFLGVPYSEPKTRLKKQNPEKLQELVLNYHELKSQFIGTEWEPFFEE